jgi:Holliday junction resolvasome RuvABC endonuclease subunit
MAELRVLGFDPSLNNWGIAAGIYCTDTAQLTVKNVLVTRPDLPKGKQVRQNSKDLTAAQQLAAAALDVAPQAHAIFVEVPVGSQSARAMASYGVCVGILGTLRAQGIPFFEVTPTEVKTAAVGTKNATKSQMIQWAMSKHPDAGWPTYLKNGKTLVSEAQAEHMADAIAAIEAGLQLEEFRRLMLMRA